jgi:hypothetical protein
MTMKIMMAEEEVVVVVVTIMMTTKITTTKKTITKTAQHNLDRTQASHDNARIRTGRQIAPPLECKKKVVARMSIKGSHPEHFPEHFPEPQMTSNSNNISRLHQRRKVGQALSKMTQGSEEKLEVIPRAGLGKSFASSRMSCCMSRLRGGEMSAFRCKMAMVRVKRFFNCLPSIRARRYEL